MVMQVWVIVTLRELVYDGGLTVGVLNKLLIGVDWYEDGKPEGIGGAS